MVVIDRQLVSHNGLSLSIYIYIYICVCARVRACMCVRVWVYMPVCPIIKIIIIGGDPI